MLPFASGEDILPGGDDQAVAVGRDGFEECVGIGR